MKKKLLVLVLSAVMAVGMMSGCGAKSDTSDTKAKTAESSSAKEEETEERTECEIEDGTYTAEFKTDSGMFHVNEANDGKGTLTVKDGKMTIHVSLVSKKIVNLFEDEENFDRLRACRTEQEVLDLIDRTNAAA